MECFRIDESGYTGFDLMNSEQRFQGAAAVAISNEHAKHLIKEHFPKLQAVLVKSQRTPIYAAAASSFSLGVR